MVRHRKGGKEPHKNPNNETSSSSGSSDTSVAKKPFKMLSLWKTAIGFICLVVAIYGGVVGYLETRVNTPFDDAKVVQKSGLEVPDRYWGTYRSGVYLGMKGREPWSPVFGLMWYELAAAAQKGIRHWCDQNDNLPSYGWLRHDGVTFGEQFISDTPHHMVTSFVKTPGGAHGGHWTARINVTATARSPGPFVMVWYGALDESLGPASPHSRLWMESGDILGHTTSLRNFKLSLVPHKGKILHKSFSEAHAEGVHLLKEKFYGLLRGEKHPKIGNIAVLTEDDEINDKVIVTGGTDGIGKHYAKELARHGINLVIISRNPDKLKATATEIEREHNVKTKTVVADFSKGPEVYAHIEEELKDIPVGILVNNVGVQYDYPMELGDLPMSKAWEIVHVNVGAVTSMTRLVIKDMARRGRGAVVNVSSGSELQPLPLMAVYAATKAYVRSFTLAIREEYAPKGIHVQHMSPLFVSTKMNSFSQRLLDGNLLVPDAATYARNAAATLGRVHDTTGYWLHGIQYFFIKIAPVWMRIKIGHRLNKQFRVEYDSNKL